MSTKPVLILKNRRSGGLMHLLVRPESTGTGHTNIACAWYGTPQRKQSAFFCGAAHARDIFLLVFSRKRPELCSSMLHFVLATFPPSA